MAEPVAVSASIKELPPEIWKQVLSNLDSSVLMICRLVNQCWKHLANEVLRELINLWEPTFEKAFEVISGRRGTRFSTAEQMTRFMEEMKGTPNPFPNGTVIFTPDMELTKDEKIAFQSKFLEFLEVFKDNDVISNVIYSMIWISERPEEMYLLVEEIFSIFASKKLKNLVLGNYFNFKWDTVYYLRCKRRHNLFREIESELNGEILPVKSTSVHICGLSGVIPLFYFLEGTDLIRKSVSSLEILNSAGGRLNLPPNPESRLDMPLFKFPNLKRLKVRYPDAEFLKSFQQFKPNSKASLKEISLFFWEGQGLELQLSLKKIFALLDLHAETLELLYLRFGSFVCAPHDLFKMQPTFTGLGTSVKYSKLKTIVLQYNNLYYWPIGINELMTKFVNLQELKLLLPHGVGICPREQYATVVAFWNILPTSVKVITVPDYGWKIKRGETLEFDEAGEVVKIQ